MDRINLYAAADLHGRQSRLGIVARQAARPEIHAVVLAGDLVNYGRGHGLLTHLAALPKPVYAVRGNTDPSRIEAAMAATRGIRSLHLEVRRPGPYAMVGVSGTLPIPFRSRVCWAESKVLRRLTAMVTPRSILVAHSPPWGACDRVAGRWHAGSRGLRRLIAARSPAVMICGHIHEAAGIARLGRTLVVNCALGKHGRGAIISYDGHRRPTARML
jgi:Icc-related predicted phosphoesterase